VTDFARLLGALHDGGVECFLVGGLAATVHGSARLTQDVDVVYRRTPENMNRLAAALAPLNPYPRGAPEGLPFDWSSSTLKAGLNFTLTTTAGPLNLFGEIIGGGTFDDLADQTSTVTLFDRPIQCLRLPALIRAKRAAGRPKDFEAVAELEALAAERDRQ
jgi:hypothetical protein